MIEEKATLASCELLTILTWKVNQPKASWFELQMKQKKKSLYGRTITITKVLQTGVTGPTLCNRQVANIRFSYGIKLANLNKRADLHGGFNKCKLRSTFPYEPNLKLTTQRLKQKLLHNSYMYLLIIEGDKSS